MDEYLQKNIHASFLKPINIYFQQIDGFLILRLFSN